MKNIAVLHCSSDVNYFWQGDDHHIIPYQDLERQLPEFLVERMRSDPFDQIVVINGPGGFSQLRIACLCVNLLKSYYPHLKIFTRNKVDLMHEFWKGGSLPQYQIMHIGMKKKLRNVDLKQKDAKDLRVDTFENSSPSGAISIDMMQHHLLLENTPNLRDEMIVYSISDQGLVCTYQDQSSILGRDALMTSEHMTDYLQPDYMIQPQIG